MTSPRNDDHSTEFGLWLRNQDEIDSRIGYRTTNIDFMWQNYKTKEYMLIEEKRYMSEPKWWQGEMFNTIHAACKSDPKYKGFYFLQFERTSPKDGKVFLNRREITTEQLIAFLQFKQQDSQ